MIFIKIGVNINRPQINKNHNVYRLKNQKHKVLDPYSSLNILFIGNTENF